MKSNPKHQNFPLGKEEIIRDYQVAFTSRQASLLGRKEVLGGKAKFGIFGDGKEVAQVAMARAFNKGDWRSGYYRDQTFMFAIGASDTQKFFAQLYADTNQENEPASSGRQMNSHFATRYVDDEGNWLNQCMMFNSSSDISPTGGQMARLLGLAYASKLYRELPDLAKLNQFSVKGNEIAFGTIGDASTSEGIFWEVINAAGVLQVPMLMSVWDDGYGISVPKKFQTTKESISQALAGMKNDGDGHGGLEIVEVNGWDYPLLVETYQKVAEKIRETHLPALLHVQQLTQPQGHSTSGSHERYKNEERMRFEEEFDCLKRMRDWMVENGYASGSELDQIEGQSIEEVRIARDQAWENLQKPIEIEREKLLAIFSKVAAESSQPEVVEQAISSLKRAPSLGRRVVATSAKRLKIKIANENIPAKNELEEFIKSYHEENQTRYSKYLLNESDRSALKIESVPAEFDDKPEKIDGSQIIQRCFDHLLAEDPRLFIIGEDVGHLGGVNTEFDGLQQKHGFWRVTDTGIREATILGQGIGAAMRGLRPLVDIQYLDYVLYCLQVMSDDLATLHYRSGGIQSAPVIVRSKGHRLEGIWHTGSHMGGILHLSRGMHFCVPRNMVQAAGMYNTLFASDDPAFVCEVLNGYRLKEAVPSNLKEFRVALGEPEVLRSGHDITIVTYGACVRIAMDAAQLLTEFGIEVEVIDVQTLMPFDRVGSIAESLKKTNAVLFLDEDVSGGASAFMMQQVLDKQNGYDYLDAKPVALSAKDHRSAYASDGDYYSKPNAEDVFEEVYRIVAEREPFRFPSY